MRFNQTIKVLLNHVIETKLKNDWYLYKDQKIPNINFYARTKPTTFYREKKMH